MKPRRTMARLRKLGGAVAGWAGIAEADRLSRDPLPAHGSTRRVITLKFMIQINRSGTAGTRGGAPASD